MIIKPNKIKVKDLVKGYLDKNEKGVVGYNGLLDIRPPYQREFVYKDEQRNKVIDTVQKGFPLNVFYWVDMGNGSFEILDGQQRTISICQFFNNEFSVNGLIYDNLPSNKKQDFDNYELAVYECSGTDSDKLDWFKTINIAGEKLTNQELRNAIYTGPWLIDAKKHFSHINCVAQQKASKLLTGSSIRQDYLETVLRWISHRDNNYKIDIEWYMSKHQTDNDADILWQYFLSVIDWVNRIFKPENYRQEMKGIEWGIFYNKYNSKIFNTNDVEMEIKRLMEDDDVSYKKGIYEYILSGNEKSLNIRAFTDKDKAQAFEKQIVSGTGKACCPKCNDNSKLFTRNQMQADHIIPWSNGGKTTLANCQMLCNYHNGVKSNN